MVIPNIKIIIRNKNGFDKQIITLFATQNLSIVLFLVYYVFSHHKTTKLMLLCGNNKIFIMLLKHLFEIQPNHEIIGKNI